MQQADSFRTLSQYEKSLFFSDRILDDADSPLSSRNRAALLKIESLIALGYLNTALDAWRKHLQNLQAQDPSLLRKAPNSRMLPLLVEILLAEGLHTEAQQIHDRYGHLFPDAKVRDLQQAILLRRNGEHPLAKARFQALLKYDLSPNQRLRTLKEAAFNLYRLDEKEKALSLIDQADSLASMSVLAKDLHADLLSIHAYIRGREGQDSLCLALRQRAANLYRHYGIHSRSADACYKNLAISYYSEADFDQAHEMFDRSYQLNKALGDPSRMGMALAGLGDVYRSLQDWDRALDHYQQAIRLLPIPEQRAEILALANAYNGSADVYEAKNNFAEAVRYYQRAFEPLRQLSGDNSASIAILHSNIANPYVNQGNYPEAIANMRKARAIFKSQGSENEVDLLQSNLFLSYLYAATDKQDSALLLRQEALRQIREIGDLPALAQAVIHETLGIIALKLGQAPEALNYFQKALQAYVIGFDSEDPSRNPQASQVLSAARVHDLITLKAEAYLALSSVQDSLDAQQKAFEAFKDAAKLIPLIRKGQNRTGSKLTLGSQKISFFEKALDLSYALYQDSGNPDYLEAAFTFSEQARAAILLEAVQEQEQLSSGSSDSDSLQLLQGLNRQIGLAEKMATEAENAKVRDSLSARVFRLRDEYDQLSRQLTAKASTRISQVQSSIEEVQNLLPGEGSALIEYFWGDSVLYIFTLSPQKADLQKLPLHPSHYQAIDTFLQKISLPSPNSLVDSSFIQASAQLYDLLLGHLSQEETDRLIVVPSGPLNRLPFDALLQKVPRDLARARYHQLDWAIRHFTISNHWSATFYSFGKQSKGPTTAKDILGVSPDFAQYAPLPMARQHIELLGEEYDQSSIFLGKRATKKDFLAQAGDHRVLDLATHGYIYPDQPNLSGLIFARQDRSAQDDTLFMFELYNQNWQADLAILEACETGSGQLSRGEGVMSLARGFTLAGCRAVIMSYWKLDDKNSSKILHSFYGYLPEGKAQAEALRQAKLDLIQQAKGAKAWQSHPYYWAAFTHIGNNGKLDLQKRKGEPWWVWFLLGSGILAGLAGIYLLKKM